ncbi:hypothetical protein [Nostoc sp. FACHB-133]|nr:hypothetical protein [Nostoc sp. FACHB-133]MBD2526766.1 hypothetical protein [Nostoc sp. FACHB-133]
MTVVDDKFSECTILPDNKLDRGVLEYMGIAGKRFDWMLGFVTQPNLRQV